MILKEALTNKMYRKWTPMALTYLVLPEIGMTPKLIKAKEDKIPKSIYSTFPEDDWRKSDGPDMNYINAEGFSLMGTTGAGKSCAMAWFVKHKIYKYIDEDLNELKENGYKTYSYDYPTLFDDNPFFAINWVYWPDAAQQIQNSINRNRSFDDWRFSPDILKKTKWLILDDLGRERFKPDSYACIMLESIINYRYEYEMTTMWNSNLDAEALIDQYGAPLVDRLRGIAPVAANGWIKLDSLR